MLFLEIISEQMNLVKEIILGLFVVAAVFINDQTKIELEKIGVKDSKLFSDNNIKVLESSIKKIIGDNFVIIQINPEKYNQLYESFNNLNKIMDGHTLKLLKL